MADTIIDGTQLNSETLRFSAPKPNSSGLIADYFIALYGKNFVFTNDNLYHYNGVYWQPDDKKNSSLSNFMDKVFMRDLITYCNEKIRYFNKVQSDENVENIKKVNILLSNVLGLRKVGNRKSLIEDIITFSTNNAIVFDNNLFLFAFNNAIYDLEKGCIIDSHPSQYISKTCGYDYQEPDSKAIDELNNLLDTIFPESDVKDYYLSILSTGLCGLQMENLFLATGAGGNGKSLINSLMLSTCGAYGYKLPSNVLLQEIKSGPNPEIANLHKIRFALVQEPNGKKRICSTTLKEMTGDKTLNVRLPYSSNCKINMNLSLIMECNDFPKLDEVNDAINRRFRAIEFVSSFVDEKIYKNLTDKKNIFIANPYYKTDEFQCNNRIILFHILCEKFKEFKNKGFIMKEMPPSCLKITNQLLAISDDIYGWFNDTFEKDANEILPFKKIFDIFKSGEYYSRLSKTDQRSLNKDAFYSKIEKNLFLHLLTFQTPIIY